MIGNNSNDEKVLQAAAHDCALMIQALIKKYRHHPNILAQALTDSLGVYTAVIATKPEQAIREIADRLLEMNITKIKSEFFGFTVLPGGKDVEDSNTK